MQIKQSDLDEVVKAHLINSDQAKQLWTFWKAKQEQVPQFSFSHVMYYFGGFLAISAMTLFVTQAWELLVGIPLFCITTLLFILGCLMSRYFISKKLLVPAGILSTFSLVMVPLAVYNLQIWLGFVPRLDYRYADFHYLINGYWVPMELCTLVVGAIMLYLFDFPFLLFPISIALWYLSMDLYSLLFQKYDFSQRATFSMVFGLLVIATAIYADFKYDNRKNYAFWLYVFGVMAFWGGLSCQYSDSELSKLFYCFINFIMILVSVFLRQRVFAIFGAIGILGYLGHLSYTLFANSLLFPILLVFLGFGIIFAATRWVRMETKLFKIFKPYIPQKILNRMHDQ